MQKKKYRFNKDLFGTPSGFIMGDIKGVVMHPDNDVLEEPVCIIGSGNEIPVVTKQWAMTPLDTLSIPDNEIWFQADSWQEPSIYSNPYENWEDYQDQLNGLLIDREERSITINGQLYYRWVFQQPVTTLGVLGSDDYIANSGIGILGGRDESNECTLICLPPHYIVRQLNEDTRDPYCFGMCNSINIETFVIPNGLPFIRSGAFSGCESLLEITIPNSVTSIGRLAFSGCTSLSPIIIPNSVISIGDYAFRDCSSLTSITCEATTPPTLGSYNNLSNVTAVYVPAESVDLYKNATNWSYYSNVIQPIST